MMTNTINTAVVEQARGLLENLENQKKDYPLEAIISTARAIFEILQSAGLPLKALDPSGNSTEEEVFERIQRAAIGAYFWDIDIRIVELESGVRDISKDVKEIRQDLEQKSQSIYRLSPSAEDVFGPLINGPLTSMRQAFEMRIQNVTTQYNILQIKGALECLNRFIAPHDDHCERIISYIEELLLLITNDPFAPNEVKQQTVEELNTEFAQARFNLYCRIITANIEELNDPRNVFTVRYMKDNLPCRIEQLAGQATEVISQLSIATQKKATNILKKTRNRLELVVIRTCLRYANNILNTLGVRVSKGKSDSSLLTHSIIKERVSEIDELMKLAQTLNEYLKNCNADIQRVEDHDPKEEILSASAARLCDRINPAEVTAELANLYDRINPAIATASLANLQAGVLTLNFNNSAYPLRTVPTCIINAILTISREFYKAANDPQNVNAIVIAAALETPNSLPHQEVPIWIQNKFTELAKLANMAAEAQARIAVATAPSPGGGS